MLADTYLYWADGVNVSESLLTDQNLDTTLAASYVERPAKFALDFLGGRGVKRVK